MSKAKWMHFGFLSIFLMMVFFSRWTGKPILKPDSFTYMATSHAMLHGKGYLEMWGRGPLHVPPLYPLLIAAGDAWLGLEPESAAFLISVLSGSLLILLVFLWASKRLGWIWAWVAALLVTFNTTLVFYGLSLLTESLFTLLFFAATGLSWVFLRRRGHPLLGLGTGVLMGLAILTKSPAWILPVFLLGWICFHGIRGRYPVRQALNGGVALIVGVLLITQPVAWISQIPEGRGALSDEKNLVSQLLMKPDLRDAMERERYLGALTPAGDQFQVEVNQGLTQMDLLKSRGMEIVKLIFLNMGLAIQSLFVLIPWWILFWILACIVIQWVTKNREGLASSGYLLLGFSGLRRILADRLTDLLYQRCRAKFSSRIEYWNQLRCTIRIMLFAGWEDLLRLIIAPSEAQPP